MFGWIERVGLTYSVWKINEALHSDEVRAKARYDTLLMCGITANGTG